MDKNTYYGHEIFCLLVGDPLPLPPIPLSSLFFLSPLHITFGGGFNLDSPPPGFRPLLVPLAAPLFLASPLQNTLGGGFNRDSPGFSDSPVLMSLKAGSPVARPAAAERFRHWIWFRFRMRPFLLSLKRILIRFILRAKDWRANISTGNKKTDWF